MRRHVASVLVTTVLAVVIVAGGCRAAMESGELDEFVTRLRQLVPREMEAASVHGVSILVVRDGEIVWSEAWGWADAARNRPLTTSTTLMVHSISKSVTAWGVMKLVQDGRIGLDDPVARHLPALELAAHPPPDALTVRTLLSHSSGLPLGPIGVHYAPHDTPLPLGERIAMAHPEVGAEPGSHFEYSNLGYGLLQWLVEEVTGQEFAAYMEQQVLQPLGMRASGFTWRREYAGDVPDGSDLRGQAISPYAYPYTASGGLFAPIEDLARFVTAELGTSGRQYNHAAVPGQANEEVWWSSHNPVLNERSIAILHTPQIQLSGVYGLVSDSYGLGHFLESINGADGQPVLAVWHGGQGLGWLTHFHVVPETGDGIVIVSNSQRSWPLIARVLNEWTDWRGLGRVGMGRIATLASLARVLGWVLAALVTWRLWLLVRAVQHMRHGIALRLPGRLSRAAWLVFGVALLALLVWAANQDYLFVTSVLPSIAPRLAWLLLALACASIATALLPRSPRGVAAVLVIITTFALAPPSLHGQAVAQTIADSSDVTHGNGTVADTADVIDGSRYQSDSAEYRGSWAALPFVAYTPESGVMAGGLAGYYRRLTPHVPTSSSVVALTLTAKKQFMLEWMPDVYLSNGMRVVGALRLQHFPDVFYGIGPDAPAAAKEGFTARSATLDTRVLWPVGRNVRVGVSALAREEQIRDMEADGLLASGTVVGSDGGTTIGLGVAATWDSRDNVFAPTRGSYVEGVWLLYDDAIGSDFHFHRVVLDARHFIPTGPRTVLGLHGYLNVTPGPAPFTVLPPLGGSDIMRGYRKGRYRDRALVVAQAELRFPAWRRFSGVVFIAAGGVAPRVDEIVSASLRTSAGGGVRYAWNEAGAVLRGDLGFGREGAELYLTLGHAF